MISPANAIVQLNGKTYRELASIEISQSVNSHHYFSIHIGSQRIGEAGNSFLEKARDYIGTDMALEIQSSLKEKLIFKGIITRVRSSATSRSELGHTVIFEGYSPTLLLDNGQHCQAYIDKNLKDIAGEVCRDFPVNSLRPEISPLTTDKIAYTLQYLETPFNFLNRLACRYGEWFYFDGQSLVFGHKKQPVIELIYGTDLLNFDIGMSVSPLVQSFASRIYKEDSTQNMGISGQSTTMKGLASFAMDKSAKTFIGKPVANLQQFDDDAAIAKQMDDIARLTIQGEAARKVSFSGTSIDPGLFPGAVISVNNLSGHGKVKQGEYIITSVNHSWETGGHYHNTFTAIPSDAEVSPCTNPLLFPVSQSQPAIVTDNNDPDGLGRVKLRFSWQKYGDSPWVRIAMPYGGPNKGVYFVPEVNEEVMVGFEGGNAEKPYVQGMVYNGSAKPGDFQTDGNDIKAIRTRSGHTIEFNDKAGNESIIISDSKGNTIQLDTVSGSLMISAPENISISAKNIDISAQQNISIGARDNLNAYAGEDYTLTAKNMTVQAEENSMVQAKNIEHNADKVRIDSTKDPLELASGKTVDLQSGEKVRLF